MNTEIFNKVELSKINIVLNFVYERVLNRLKNNNSIVIKLNGNLGAGKTTFVKELIQLNSTTEATSPTFAIVNEYEGKIKINHFDFYRINEIEELYDLGFEEYISQDNSITLIEWAELFNEVIPSDAWEINIEYNDNNSRNYIVRYE
ncbi:MAG TPA: tRNA (adenosine(37)-N6)-threonylcarbamoyltransferase complex ATPase subunit type 1 TsaE [Ignavibacteriales bacterium]|nr:tRNA (adenosine(37)-N6)-threonylcarbamoyltransferase complex ATPase subunit type 1 TsaE [Ignavibacteriales bacterium]